MKKKNYTLGYHLVASLDVQGQRVKFRQFCGDTTFAKKGLVSEV
jgi:hypothetical protein